MEIKTDIALKGRAWKTAIEDLSGIFANRTHYSIFMLCLAIGIMYDQRIEEVEAEEDEIKSVPRKVINNNDNGKLDICFQAAILSTLTVEMSEDERLELAFGEKTDFNKMGFLLSFANFGAEKLVELIGNTELDSMENIKNFMVKTVEGRNFDIDALPIDDIDFDMFD